MVNSYMKKRWLKFIFLFSVLVALFIDLSIAPKLAFGDVACSSDISYSWAKGEPATGGEAKDRDGAQGNSTAGERLNFISIERRGVDEGAAKGALLVEVNRQKARAYDRCKRDHESFGDCVATKMASKGATLNSLSFSSRTRVEQALIVECQGQQGRCGAIESSEPVCREIKSAKVGILTNDGQERPKDEGAAAGKPLGEVEPPQGKDSSKEQQKSPEGAAASANPKGGKAGSGKGRAKG